MDLIVMKSLANFSHKYGTGYGSNRNNDLFECFVYPIRRSALQEIENRIFCVFG